MMSTIFWNVRINYYDSTAVGIVYDQRGVVSSIGEGGQLTPG